MAAGRNDQETAFAIRELSKEIDTLRRDSTEKINDKTDELHDILEKNGERIRDLEEALNRLPTELDKTLRELIEKEFSSERSLEMARKILDGLRQGMHLFLGGTLSGPSSREGSLLPAAVFPPRPPNPYTVASQKEEAEAAEEASSDVPIKKRPVTASFSIDKDGKVDITVDKNSRLALAAGIVGLIAAVGWLVQAIMNSVHK